MPRYEYKVVPAPKKPGKIKGVRGTEAKFAAELAGLMNEYGAEGWEYQRTDTLPCEERQGLTGKTTTFQNMLVFRREVVSVVDSALSETHRPSVALRAVEDAPIEDLTPEETPGAADEPREATEPATAARGPMVTFRSASIAASSETPPVAATRDVPEGKAPEIRFRASDIAAQ